MDCPSCGETVQQGDARFCPSCGKELPWPEAMNSREPGSCPACETKQDAHVRACKACGALLRVPMTSAERTSAFVGRRSAVRRITDWLQADPVAEPVLILTGNAGSGKTALMSWLCGVGSAPSDPETALARENVRNTIDAAHFCVAVDSGTNPSLDPARFATGLSEQLSLRVAGYGAWLLANADRQTDIRVQQMAGHAAGSMIGVNIEHFYARDPASIFSSVIQPLEVTPGGHDHIVVLVDALDEAELWPASPTIGELIAGAVDTGAGSLQGRIRFIVTTRPNEDVLSRFPRAVRWDLFEDGDDNLDDVIAYVRTRIQDMIGKVDEVLVQKFADASEGNFLYAKTALDYWLPRLDEFDPASGPDLPPTLNGIYSSFLQREYGSKEGPTVWANESRPLLGALGTAQGKLDDRQLGFILDMKQSAPLQRGLERCAPYLDGDRPSGPFGVYHESFREFLLDAAHNSKFLVSAADSHAHTAGRYLENYGQDWDSCFDSYGLRHTATHLAEGAHGSEQPRRHNLLARLVELVGDEGFCSARERRLGDVAALQRDLERTVEEACRNDSPTALRLVFDSAHRLSAFREEQTDPRRIFDAASQGDLVRAERRLAIFFADRHWHDACLMVAIWFAGDKKRQQADERFKTCEADSLDVRPLPWLAERLSLSLSDDPPESLDTDLPRSTPAEYVEAILDRMRGAGGSEAISEEILAGRLDHPSASGEVIELLAQLDQRRELLASELAVEQIMPGADSESAFLGGVDGPYLVDFALENPRPGNAYLEEYIELLAANGYVFYRNRSLWALFANILRHPNQAWVREFSRRVCEAALAGTRIHFADATYISRRAVEAKCASPEARNFDDVVALVDSRFGESPAPDRGLAEPVRGPGDTWGHGKRSLGAVAEAVAIVIGDHAVATARLDKALGIHFGFAGFESPACLSLAESCHIIDSLDTERHEFALRRAGKSAHCVQDPTFCARATSRYNALDHLWRARREGQLPSDELRRLIGRFIENPYDPEFTALHVVGETYAGRQAPPVHLEIPVWARDATTLRDIALFYERNVADVVRVNRMQSWTADDVVPPGAELRIPDPEMPYSLAGFFSAVTIASADFDDAETARLIQLMVPTVISNVTALDRQMARLLLVSKSPDPKLLDRLPNAFTNVEMTGPDGAVSLIPTLIDQH